jgi:hypothetical protein
MITTFILGIKFEYFGHLENIVCMYNVLNISEFPYMYV